MSDETIELIKILRDVTQSKAVYDRCGAELKRISAQPNWGAHNKRVEASPLGWRFMAWDTGIDAGSVEWINDRTPPAQSGTPS